MITVSGIVVLLARCDVASLMENDDENDDA